jgi:hypothetical protein
MTPRFVETWFPASTADAESAASLEFAGGTLVLSFRDWQGTDKRVEFREVVAFRWAPEDTYTGLRDDMTYEVHDSAWRASLVRGSVIADAKNLCHVLIGFNEEAAWLEVVCGSIHPEKEGPR